MKTTDGNETVPVPTQTTLTAVLLDVRTLTPVSYVLPSM